MGDIKLKKGTGILFVMAVFFISSLIYLHYGCLLYTSDAADDSALV